MRALLVVDVQKNMVEGKYSVPNAVEFLAKFEKRIGEARDAGVPVIWVQNDGPEGDIDEPFSPGWELYFVPAEGERVVRKGTPATNFADTWEVSATELAAKVQAELEKDGVLDA